MVVARAPFTVAVGVEDGAELVFGGRQIVEHHLLFVCDDLLPQYFSAFVGELHKIGRASWRERV